MIYNYGKQFIDKTDIASVVEVLKSDNLTQGKFNNKFENKLKKYFGSKFCTVSANGTAALHMALSSLNLKKNEILSSSKTELENLKYLNTINFGYALDEYKSFINEP